MELDHLGFTVDSRAGLEEPQAMLGRGGVPRGGITEMACFGVAVLEFRDPDNIQLELTSPMG